MLKSVLLNGKKVPVPVPVRTAGEALDWLEKFLVGPKKTVTKIELNGENLTDASLSERLDQSSKLVVQVDSEIDLAVQTIDALRNLTGMMIKDIKHCAVQVYQLKPEDKLDFIDNFVSDLNLALELSEHLLILVNGQISTKYMAKIMDQVGQVTQLIEKSRVNQDWQHLARVILQHLEPNLEAMAVEMSSLQKSIFQLQTKEACGSV